MATLVSSHSPNKYHQQQPYFNSTLSSFYGSKPHHNNYYQPKSQKPIVTIEYIDSDVQPSRPRRQPRIHRQVILLPTPDPIYRQVRHRLPTPERPVIQRTTIQKGNRAIVVEQQRHREKTSSKNRSETTTQTRSPRTRQINND
jgi:hypothetical protein